MDPASIGVFIPIIALAIPIVAIISSTLSKKYKYLANETQAEYVRKLEARVNELESTVQRMNDEVVRLEDNQRFMSRLLEEKR